jgi:hypothetical protein
LESVLDGKASTELRNVLVWKNFSYGSRKERVNKLIDFSKELVQAIESG